MPTEKDRKLEDAVAKGRTTAQNYQDLLFEKPIDVIAYGDPAKTYETMTALKKAYREFKQLTPPITPPGVEQQIEDSYQALNRVLTDAYSAWLSGRPVDAEQLKRDITTAKADVEAKLDLINPVPAGPQAALVQSQKTGLTSISGLVDRDVDQFITELSRRDEANSSMIHARRVMEKRESKEAPFWVPYVGGEDLLRRLKEFDEKEEQRRAARATGLAIDLAEEKRRAESYQERMRIMQEELDRHEYFRMESKGVGSGGLLEGSLLIRRFKDPSGQWVIEPVIKGKGKDLSGLTSESDLKNVFEKMMTFQIQTKKLDEPLKFDYGDRADETDSHNESRRLKQIEALLKVAASTKPPREIQLGPKMMGVLVRASEKKSVLNILGKNRGKELIEQLESVNREARAYRASQTQGATKKPEEITQALAKSDSRLDSAIARTESKIAQVGAGPALQGEDADPLVVQVIGAAEQLIANIDAERQAAKQRVEQDEKAVQDAIAYINQPDLTQKQKQEAMYSLASAREALERSKKAYDILKDGFISGLPASANAELAAAKADRDAAKTRHDLAVAADNPPNPSTQATQTARATAETELADCEAKLAEIRKPWVSAVLTKEGRDLEERFEVVSRELAVVAKQKEVLERTYRDDLGNPDFASRLQSIQAEEAKIDAQVRYLQETYQRWRGMAQRLQDNPRASEQCVERERIQKVSRLADRLAPEMSRLGNQAMLSLERTRDLEARRVATVATVAPRLA